MSSEEVNRADADSSIELRLSQEEDARAADVVSINTRVSSEEDARAAADTSLETRFSGEVSVESARIDAIVAGTGSPDLENFSQVVSYINAVDTTNDDAVASHVVSINARISAESSTRVVEDASLESSISSEVSARQSAVQSLEDNHSALISSENSSISSLETRENNRHNKIAFSSVASLTVAGSSFPSGFDMSEHGMIQLFEEDGSGNLHHLIAPMEIDMTTGDITFTFESAISGVAVFYSFADDEGTVTV